MSSLPLETQKKEPSNLIQFPTFWQVSSVGTNLIPIQLRCYADDFDVLVRTVFKSASAALRKSGNNDPDRLFVFVPMCNEDKKVTKTLKELIDHIK